jgi:hypothetical protein
VNRIAHVFRKVCVHLSDTWQYTCHDSIICIVDTCVTRGGLTRLALPTKRGGTLRRFAAGGVCGYHWNGAHVTYLPPRSRVHTWTNDDARLGIDYRL